MSGSLAPEWMPEVMREAHQMRSIAGRSVENGHKEEEGL